MRPDIIKYLVHQIRMILFLWGYWIWSLHPLHFHKSIKNCTLDHSIMMVIIISYFGVWRGSAMHDQSHMFRSSHKLHSSLIMVDQQFSSLSWNDLILKAQLLSRALKLNVLLYLKDSVWFWRQDRKNLEQVKIMQSLVLHESVNSKVTYWNSLTPMTLNLI
jgi:hypothetical protein